MKPYLRNEFPDEMKDSSVDELKRLGEQEFINYYGTFPSCAVFAPGCLAIAGESAGFVENKSLCMAIQLATVIVGKRNRGSKWCHVKTLAREVAGQKTFKFHSSAENLYLAAEETSWIRYVKGTMQSFKAKRGHVPGFKILIISNVPVKRGLASSSALVVAMYTFLEAITNTYTTSVFEKTLACQLAEKLAIGSCDVRLADILTSMIGQQNKAFAFDARTLRIDEGDWDSTNVELVLVQIAGREKNDCWQRPKAIRWTDVSIFLNTVSQWRTHPDGTSAMELLFSRQTISDSERIVDEDNRVSRMLNAVRAGRWRELGKLLRENYNTTRKRFKSLPDDIERIVNALETIDGVLGAKVISRRYGASVLVLVQRSKLKTFIYTLSRIKNSQDHYYIAKPSIGASVLYTYEDQLLSWNDKKRLSYRTKLLGKYHVRDQGNAYNLQYYDKSEPTKSISLFIPHGTFLD